MNPIVEAVSPLKNDAMERAERYARKVAGSVGTKLAQANYDLRIAAPYPSSRLGRNDYKAQLATYKLFQRLTTWRPNQIVGMHTSCFADMNPEFVEKFVQDARDNAAAQYDLFVAKLNKKIGPAASAKLEGNHVWSYSFLHVVTAAGVAQCWKTQTIVNTSKLGTIFNQFPTRLVKRQA